MKYLIISALFILGCGSANTDSELYWGRLNSSQPTFINAKTMMVCGPTELRKVANDALWEWNNARGVHHRLMTAVACDRRRLYDGSAKLSFGSCPANVVGYHTQSGNHHDITVCNGVSSVHWFKVMAHELGHAYGLCDQYAPGNASQIVFHPNCGWPRSSSAARSIMGGLYQGSPSQLTQDDIQGIKYLQKHYAN